MDLSNNQDYFVPFSRQKVYSSMQPFAMNFTLMNRESVHSKLIEKPTYNIMQEDDGALNSSVIQEHKCIQLDFQYPSVMYPYFG